MSQAQIDKAIEVIERNAKAQNLLIGDLLDVSRIIRGTMQLQLEPTSLDRVIMASLDTVLPSASAKNIEVIDLLESNLPKVNADKEKLQQIFWNLLINAIKFTPVGGKISVSALTTQNTVTVKVTDTGKGIAADVLPFVFDRFRQAETKSSTRTSGGLGLGLAIVRHLVEIHGGRVMADSQGLNNGSTFTIELPVVANTKSEITATKSDLDRGSSSLAQPY